MANSNILKLFVIVISCFLSSLLQGQTDTTNSITFEQFQKLLNVPYSPSKPKVEKTLYHTLNQCYEFKDSLFTGSDTITPIDDLKLFDEKLVVVRYYDKGKKVRAEGYNSQSKLITLVEFDGYVKHGWEKKWYSNGKLDYFTYYNKGVQELPAISLYENGNLKWIGEEHENRLKYVSKQYYPSGILKSISVGLDSCEFGQLNLYYRPDATMKLKMYHCDTIIFFEGYYNNGQLAYKYNWMLFHPIGLMQQWYSNGNRKLEGNIVRSTEFLMDRQLDGEWLFWNEKGELVMNRLYKNGTLLNEKIIGKIDPAFFDECIFPENCELD